jgi:diguanylate cyclase (GGDEF)-like protein
MATIIERKQLADAILGSQEQLISMARIDALTGVCNRAVFDDVHPTFHTAAIEQNQPYAVVMIDVDRFKAYNDRYGHLAGDDALRNVATAVSSSLRDTDFVARYGGEELVVLLAEVTEEQAVAVTERLRRGVERLGLRNGAGDGPLTLSAGVAVMDPSMPKPPRELVLAADEALYLAKVAGRNRVQMAGPGCGPQSDAA